jgi:hypothetical protein
MTACPERVFCSASTGVSGRDLVDIGAGDECLLTGPGNDGATDFRIVFGVLECRAQIGECSLIEGVEDLGTIHRDVREPALLLVKNGFER